MLINQNKNSKGFIQIPILIAIIVGILIVGAGGYFGLRQYQNIQNKKMGETEQKARDLITAQQKVDDAKEGLKKADDNSKQVTQNAVQQQTKSEGVDKLIQKSNISVITEVKKLSDSEVEKLGFAKFER